MKDQPFLVTEHHPSGAVLPGQIIRQAITAWLAKQLHK